MIGSAYIPDPVQAQEVLDSLRRDLLADPYFSGVPSMKRSSGKTAAQFHAKNDLPEIRREFFRANFGLNIMVAVAVRRKSVLAIQRRATFQAGANPSQDSIYDELVGNLFRSSKFASEETHISFARRGKALRHQAFSAAIHDASEKVAIYLTDEMMNGTPPVVESDYPTAQAGLQIVDYCLWVIQRLFERSEDKSYKLIERCFYDICDSGDRRRPAI